MTQLAHDCARLRIPYDSWRLYAGDEPGYELWLHAVRDRVNDSQRHDAERMKRKAR